DDGPSDAVRLHDYVAPAGVALEIVRGTDYALARVQEPVNVTMPVDVVACRDDVDAGFKKLLGGSLGYPEAARNVLAVGHDEIGRVTIAQHRQRVDDRLAPRLADDVAQEEE